MVFGNLFAITQSNFRRLLAYSAVAHGGYALLGLIANSPRGLEAVLFYAITYGLTIIGLFAVATIIEKEHGEIHLVDFAGLARTEPLLAVCLMVLMLSLAGIPPLAGFFGKFYLFVAVLRNAQGSVENLWLVIVAIGASAVSLYYYLQVLKQAFVAPANGVSFGPVSALAKGVVVALAAVILLLGCFPDLLVEPLRQAQLQSTAPLVAGQSIK
jgi:NADH-quinone oxidoreductase subunit N